MRKPTYAEEARARVQYYGLPTQAIGSILNYCSHKDDEREGITGPPYPQREYTVEQFKTAMMDYVVNHPKKLKGLLELKKCGKHNADLICKWLGFTGLDDTYSTGTLIGKFEKYDGSVVVSYRITNEQKDQIVGRLLQYYEKYCHDGEGIHQDDDSILNAPEVLSYIADLIIDFKTEHK
jgi:hypothetical protein